MSEKILNEEDKKLLLRFARETLQCFARGDALRQPDLSQLSPALREDGASFVTLTTADGVLRGCIGTLEAYRPLVEDVCEHTLAAALNDYRFTPVQPEEVSCLKIEISCLTIPQPLEYCSPEELIQRVRSAVDGVIFRDGAHRATFLPQVWETIPQPEDFFFHLCQKMGAPGQLWRRKPLKVFTYQVEEFHESCE